MPAIPTVKNQKQPSTTVHVWLILFFFVLIGVFAFWIISEFRSANWCNIHADELGSKIKCARFYN